MLIQEKGTNWKFFLAGSFIGAVTGAVTGILLAPRSGKESREQLGEWVKERRDKGAEILAKIKEEGLQKKEQLVAAYEAGKSAYEQTLKHAG